MTTPIANQSAVYGDFAGLEKLKSGARTQDPSALRQVAQQFESLFARMMIKSMRKAIGTDPIFGSDQAQMYQGMFDDQLSLELTRGRGLGLADMLMRQLRGGSPAPAAGASTASPSPPTASASGQSAPSSAERAEFVRSVLPQAQQAARALGVHPAGLIAQAALESNWGRSVPRGSDGDSSHNLFGVKAGGSWGGAAVSASTQEVENGAARSARAAFRSYASPAAGWKDYVSMLSSNPRYRGALNSGNDIGAFANALQQGGYATDPGYAQKVTAVAHQVASLLNAPGASETPVKFADAGSIPRPTAAL